MVDSTTTKSVGPRRPVPFPVIGIVAGIAVLAIAAGVFLATRDGGFLAGSGTGAVEPDLEAAKAAYNTGDYSGAESALGELIGDDAEGLEARKTLALALAAQGKNEEALEQYAAVVAADPMDHQTLFAMAALEQLTGKAAESISHLEAAIEIKPEPSYFQALAPIYATVGKWDECVATWQKYLELAELDETGQAQVHAAIASAYEGAREYDKAKESLGQALFLDPNNETYRARLEGYAN